MGNITLEEVTSMKPIIYSRLDGTSARLQPTPETDLDIHRREENGVSIIAVHLTSGGRVVGVYNSIWTRSQGSSYTVGEFAQELDPETIASYAVRFSSDRLAALVPLDEE